MIASVLLISVKNLCCYQRFSLTDVIIIEDQFDKQLNLTTFLSYFAICNLKFRRKDPFEDISFFIKKNSKTLPVSYLYNLKLNQFCFYLHNFHYDCVQIKKLYYKNTRKLDKRVDYCTISFR